MTEGIPRIKELYKEVTDKTDYHIAIAKKFELQPISVRTNWFSRYWAIPKWFRKDVIKFTEEYIKKLKKLLKKAKTPKEKVIKKEYRHLKEWF